MISAQTRRRASFIQRLLHSFNLKTLLQQRKPAKFRSKSVDRRRLLESLEPRWLMANDTFATAISIGPVTSSPSTINSRIAVDTDVDVIRFSVVSGATVDFNIDTSINGPGGLGSYIRLFASSGLQLAFNDDGRAPGENSLGFDAYLRYTFSFNGTYYLGISNYNTTQYNPISGNGDTAGGLYSTGSYTLIVNALPIDSDGTISSATPMGAVSEREKIVSTSITPDIDLDLYEFTVSTGQVVDFNINTPLNGPGGLGSFLRLFNSAGQQLAFNDDAAAPGEAVVGFDAYLRYTFPAVGTYYIGVSNYTNIEYNPLTGSGVVAGGFYSIGTYTLIVSTPSAILNDPDDTISEATPVGAISTTPVSLIAAIAPDIDVDMYRFTVAAGQTVDFNINTLFNGPGGLGSFPRLFSAAGQQLAFNDDGNAPGENVIGFDSYLRFLFPTSGIFYIGVSNHSNIQYNPITGASDVAGGLFSIGTYTLVVSTLPIDPDNSIATATQLGAISASEKLISASITPDIDLDLYEFTVSTGQVVDFNINTPLNGPGGLGSFLRLFNSAGQQLAFNDDAAAPGEAVAGFDAYLRYTFPAVGTYYIGVSNYTNIEYNPLTGSGVVAGGFYSIGTYTLIVSTPSAILNDPDDRISEATSVGAISTTPVSLIAAIAPDIDVDMYRFTVAAGQTVDFNINTLFNGPGGLGSFLRLFSAAGQQLAFNDDGNAPGENVIGFDSYLRYLFPTSGIFYVGVSNHSNIQYDPITGTDDVAGGLFSIGTYTLVVNTLPIDPDNSIATATQLGTITTTPKSLFAAISPDIDVDFLQVSVSAGDTVEFDIDTQSNGPSGLDSYLRLFSSIGQLLATSDNAASPSENFIGFDAFLRYTFTSSGNYYIGVSNATNKQYDPINGGGTIPAGFNSIGSYQFTVHLSETLVQQTILTLSVESNSISEKNGITVGKVTRASPSIGLALSVSLLSSDTGAVSVPAEVVIPANHSSVEFEILGVDDHVVDGVRRSTISATATNSTTASIWVEVFDSDSLWYNVKLPLDVNDNSIITATDALLVINYLNAGLHEVTNVEPPPYLVVNSDNRVSAVDALLIINYLNSSSREQGEGEWVQMEAQYYGSVYPIGSHIWPNNIKTFAIDDYFSSFDQRTKRWYH